MILKGYVIYDFDPQFRFIGNGYLFDVPVPHPRHDRGRGRGLLRPSQDKRLAGPSYAVGANKETAKMSGISVSRTKIYAFAISGFLAAVAGIVLVARINACQADIGSPYLLPTIATVYMGGASTTSGQGSIIGTVIGALIMTVVENGMNLLGVPSVWRGAIIGALIIVTVYANLWLSKKMERAAL